jgi:hypothetical protein
MPAELERNLTQDGLAAVEVQCLADRIERMPGLLSVKQVRLLPNKSKSWVYEKVQRGTIPYVYLDGSIGFSARVRLLWFRSSPPPALPTHEGMELASIAAVRQLANPLTQRNGG